jgi:hypothetical protein
MKRSGLAAALAIVAASFAAMPGHAASLDIDGLAGVYKSQFKNGNIDGGKYQSEDILEIVKISPTAAYVKAHLEFFNGHVCNIKGVADAEGGALVYHGPNNIEGKPCQLSVKLVHGKVTLDDKDGHCAIGTCGNRGMYNGTSFDAKRRRAIRYMEILLKSDDYKSAVQEHDDRAKR